MNHLLNEDEHLKTIEALKRRVDELEKELGQEEGEDSEDDVNSMNDAFIEEQESIWRHVQMTRGRGDFGDFGVAKVLKKSKSKLPNPAVSSPPSAKFQWANAKYVSLLGRRDVNRLDTTTIGSLDFEEDLEEAYSGRGDSERFAAGREVPKHHIPRVPASSPVHPIDYSEKMIKMEHFEKELEKKLFSANGDFDIDVNAPMLMKELEKQKEKIRCLEIDLQKVIHECAQWKAGYEELLQEMENMSESFEEG